MQLPRGTFREIKKNIAVSALLGELEKTGFNGVSNISYGSLTGMLVFKMGSCILADFKGLQGNAAWAELLKISDREVDAALSTLDEAQIQLSLEFNKKSRIVKPGALGSKFPARSAAHTHQKKAATSPQPAPSLQSIKAPPADIALLRKLPVACQPAIAAGLKVPAEIQPEMQKEEESTSFELDIDTFDSMNLENMTDKIRIDCKAMIKQLELEHLIGK